jgi:hydrogenase expression/formation protein HypE
VAKLPFHFLEKYVLGRTGAYDPRVICGPALGEDASIVKLNGKVLVAHADPIVGAVKHIGWLSVHIACNDIAVRGVRPCWIIPVILFPEKYSEDLVDDVTGDIHRASMEIGVTVIGGHLGYVAGSQRPLIATTALGIASEGAYVMTSTAKSGDLVLLTKGAGIEGTAIIALDFADVLREKMVPDEAIVGASRLIEEISVVKESLSLFNSGATSMHDATRGGVLEALIEVALSSHVGIAVEEQRIPLREETKIFADKLDFDPLRLISSGTVVATIPPEKLTEAQRRLNESNIICAVIGEVSKGNGVQLTRTDGKVESYNKPRIEEDELAKIWKEHPR